MGAAAADDHLLVQQQQQQQQHEPNQLLALAVFVDSPNTAHLRSMHVHEEEVGSLYTIQQDFLLNPTGGCTPATPPVMTCFRTFMSSAGVKQIMGAIIKMHENDGWHCVLAYRSDSPSETTLPHLLTPSRNLELKSTPSLEQDLKVVENALISSRRNAHLDIDDEGIVGRSSCGEGKNTHKDDCGWFSNLVLSCPSDLTLSNHSNDHLPGLETPKQTPRGQQLDIWHEWGSELELASPRVSHQRTSLSHQATLNSWSPISKHNAAYLGALWSPSTLLDLNLDLTELPSQDDNVDCTMLFLNSVSEPMSVLNLELGTPTLSLQQSTITDDSMDCFALGGDSPVSYNNAAVDPHAKLTKVNAVHNATQNAKSMCSEDSVDGYGSVINASPLDVNGNSLMTSTDMYSAAYQKKLACMNGNVSNVLSMAEANSNSSMTSSGMFSSAFKKNVECANGCMVNVSSSEVNGSSSCMTSIDMYSAAYYKKNAACIDGSTHAINVSPSDVNGKLSSDMYSAVYKTNSVCLNGEKVVKDSPATSTNHSWRGEGRAFSSGSTQSVQQHTSSAGTDNKPRIIRPGSTSERIIEITLQELSQYFSMPITQASKKLKVGLTVLKKRCREFGIPRWPHRKIKSVNSLINNIQDLAKDQGVKSSPRVQNAVKELEEQMRLMEQMPGVELADRTKKLRQACFKANYKKRRLGMSMIGNVPGVPSGAPLPMSFSHSFDIMDLNPTLIMPSPPNHHTMDHFL